MSGEEPPTDPRTRELSDLVGAELTIALIAWFLLLLAAFFFVGPITGLIVLGVGILGFGWFLVSAVLRADTTE